VCLYIKGYSKKYSAPNPFFYLNLLPYFLNPSSFRTENLVFLEQKIYVCESNNRSNFEDFAFIMQILNLNF
jgi:hypothetical protein